MAAKDYQGIGPKETERLRDFLENHMGVLVLQKNPGTRQVTLWARLNGTFDVVVRDLFADHITTNFPTLQDAIIHLNETQFTSPPGE